MRISHEAIYQALYIADRGALSREDVACLRTGSALRVPRARTRRERRNHRGVITPGHSIEHHRHRTGARHGVVTHKTAGRTPEDPRDSAAGASRASRSSPPLPRRFAPNT